MRDATKDPSTLEIPMTESTRIRHENTAARYKARIRRAVEVFNERGAMRYCPRCKKVMLSYRAGSSMLCACCKSVLK